MSRTVFTLAELANYTHSKLVGQPDYQVTNVADLESAGAQDASFLANPLYEEAMRRSRAGVVFVTPNSPLIEGRNFLINENPSRAFQQTVEAFMEGILENPTGFTGIHPTAVIHETATIGDDVTIAPYAVIDKEAIIGARTIVQAGCYVGVKTVVGEDCFLHPHVIIRERCIIGSRVIIQPGAIIGACGFGYTTDRQGKHIKLNQIGIVVIEDDVEIGANTTIDRSRFKATTISRGSKIDNLVQIGHGVCVGEDNIIVAQTGIAGSTKTGKHVIIGGQVAIAGHITITDKTMIAARSGVSKSIAKPGKYNGVPAIPLHEYNRNSVYLRNMESYVAHIKELREQLARLEEKVFFIQQDNES
jgi:UDP-3-O-[3-hydroxymyristoyl] glucosamine N-acyltransferase